MELRAHHLLCSVLYGGKGYSEGFVNNMNGIVANIKKGTTLRIKKSPDIICSQCPNAKRDGSCALDDEDKQTSDKRSIVGDDQTVKSLDSYIMEEFGLTEDEEYDSKELFSAISEKITEEFFNSCCETCRWYKSGLCSFDRYVNKLPEVLGMNDDATE